MYRETLKISRKAVLIFNTIHIHNSQNPSQNHASVLLLQIETEVSERMVD